MEIEIRAKINQDTSKHIEDKLKDLNALSSGVIQQSDIYFKHTSDVERNLVLRIRKKDSGSQLTFKSRSKKHDTAWPDVDLSLNQPDELESILRNNNYEEVVKIEKNRKTHNLDSFEINIDDIKNLGCFIEIEKQGSEINREQIERDIKKLLLKLGVTEADIIMEGYVPLMIKEQDKNLM